MITLTLIHKQVRFEAIGWKSFPSKWSFQAARDLPNFAYLKSRVFDDKGLVCDGSTSDRHCLSASTPVASKWLSIDTVCDEIGYFSCSRFVCVLNRRSMISFPNQGFENLKKMIIIKVFNMLRSHK